MIRLAPLALLVVTACATTPPPATAPGSGTQCDATAIQSIVGQASSEDVIADAEARSGARDVRQYATGSMLTMDFRADRLNVEVDGNGRIVKVSCG